MKSFIGLAAFAGFPIGIIIAFATGDWHWLALPLISWFVLVFAN